MKGERGMRVTRRDEGAALLEFVVLGIGLLVPIAYVGLAAAGVQSAAFASAQAVREAARAFASATTPAEAAVRARVAARLAFADHDLALPAGALTITCVDGPCLGPGSLVDVTLRWSVPLPWVPRVASVDAPSIPVEARQLVPIDDFRDDA